MPDGAYLTPEEEALMRMIRDGGSPQAAGRSLVERLQALESAVAALESGSAPDRGDGAVERPDGDPRPVSK